MKKIYLHMGFHKTATSSFQSTCAENLDKLATQGYIYPSFEYKDYKGGRKMYNHSDPLVSVFSPKPEQLAFNLKAKLKDVAAANKAYKKQLTDYLLLDKDLIISGEGISALDATSLQQLYTFLESQGAEVIPVICVRSPYDFHCSSSQTVVKLGRHLDFSKLRSQKEKILRIQSVFKDTIRFIPFTKACEHGQGPVGYILDSIGVNVSGVSFAIKNERRSNAYVRLQNALNKQQPSILNKKVNPKHFQIPLVEGSKFLLNEKELAAIKDKLDLEYQFFAEALGKDYCDEQVETSDFFEVDELVASYPEFFFNQTNAAKSKLENIGLYKVIRRNWQKMFGSTTSSSH